jgi:hypothetical protein
MDKDQEDADKLQKALLKKEKENFGWDSFAFGAILLALVLGAIFIAEHIANWMYFYD